MKGTITTQHQPHVHWLTSEASNYTVTEFSELRAALEDRCH